MITCHGGGFEDVDRADLDALLDRIGDAHVVLIGEASHGTSEFYRMRSRMTRRLIDLPLFDLLGPDDRSCRSLGFPCVEMEMALRHGAILMHAESEAATDTLGADLRTQRATLNEANVRVGAASRSHGRRR